MKIPKLTKWIKNEWEIAKRDSSQWFVLSKRKKLIEKNLIFWNNKNENFNEVGIISDRKERKTSL